MSENATTVSEGHNALAILEGLIVGAKRAVFEADAARTVAEKKAADARNELQRLADERAILICPFVVGDVVDWQRRHWGQEIQDRGTVVKVHADYCEEDWSIDVARFNKGGKPGKRIDRLSQYDKPVKASA